MPLVTLSLMQGKSVAHRTAIADGVHKALVEVVGVPAADRFQLIREYDRDGFIYDATYLDVGRSDDLVIVQITLRSGRSVDLKQSLYRKIVENLAADPGLRSEDVMIALTENELPDWSFGKGEAQYVR
jgi:4-oxalocrotonate tautomerase